MALLNDKNRYILIKDNNEYDVYNTILDRELVKSSPKPTDIINKYNELIKEYQNKIDKIIEKKNPTDEDFVNIKVYTHQINLMNNELASYQQDLQNAKGPKHLFPIMSTYFENVETSIPRLAEHGLVKLDGDTVKDKYESAKKLKRFGETKDI